MRLTLIAPKVGVVLGLLALGLGGGSRWCGADQPRAKSAAALNPDGGQAAESAKGQPLRSRNFVISDYSLTAPEGGGAGPPPPAAAAPRAHSNAVQPATKPAVGARR